LFFRAESRQYAPVKKFFMKKYLVEFIGTFFLVSGAAFAGGIGASLALMVMVYAGGHISGAHYNPAVSIAMYIRKKLTVADLPGYLAAQFAGALLAGVLVYYVFNNPGAGGCAVPEEGIFAALLAEFISTFALAFVVLNVASAKGTTGNSFYGLAIGATVLAMATIFGRFSGGVFNPAVGIGLAIQKSLCWKQVWIYFLAPIAGGILAAYTFLAVNEADEEPESIPDEVLVRNGGKD
jgi:aquaporin Z